MALDEPKDNDVSEEIDGLTFIVTKDTLERYKGFTIEAITHAGRVGFAITPEAQLGGSSCSSCSSCG